MKSPLSFLVLSVCALAAFAMPAVAALVAYPPYPKQIERDYAYAVRVAQGKATKRIEVYNHCEKSILSQRTHGGDVNRRFCEFAFSGTPVRVDIMVREDVSSYKIFPARLGLRHAFSSNGVVSVWLERPAYFGLQINDSDKSILSVFADAPERDVPAKGTPGVMYVEGWLDAPQVDGIIETKADVREIYIAPGSVLNARLKVRGKNTRLHGRGMVLDPMSDIFRYDQRSNTTRGVVAFGAEGCSADGIKIVDARTFNFMGFAPNLRYTNVKVLSSMMCSDGLTNGGEGLIVDNAWIYCGDNAIVVSGVRNAVYRNIAIGTSCKAIFPQNTNTNVLMENIDVFRADEGVLSNIYNGVLRRNNKWNELSAAKQKREPGPQDLVHQKQDFRFVNLSAVDCTLFSRFFQGRNMGTLPKTFVFDRLSLPHSTGKAEWRSIGRTDGVQICIENNPKRYLVTSNYRIAVTDLYLGGEVSDEFAPSTVKATPEELSLTVSRSAAARRVPLAADRRVVDFKCPAKRRRAVSPFRGNLLADRPSTRSIWQRAPSWLVKFDAVSRDDKGALVYRLTQCEKNAGMQAVITERFRSAGPGRYVMGFECRAKSGNPFGLTVAAVSNEKRLETKVAEVNRDGEWHRYELSLNLDFDEPGFDLLAIFLSATAPADEICFRNLTLASE